MVLGALFFILVTACIAFCFIVVVLASYLKQASQQAALLVSTRASVANTQVHIQTVFRHFVRAITCFIVSAALLIWIFAGLPSRVPFKHTINRSLQGDMIEELDTGSYTIMCLDIHSASANWQRDAYMIVLSSLTTLVIAAMVAWGYHTYYLMAATYEPRELLTWYSRHKLEQSRGGPAPSHHSLNRGSIISGMGEDGNDSDLDSVAGSVSSWVPGTAPLLAEASPPGAAAVTPR